MLSGGRRSRGNDESAFKKNRDIYRFRHPADDACVPEVRGREPVAEALAAKQSRFMGMTIDPDTQIVVTCGSTEAMMAAMMSVVDPGDKVVVFSPFYENYGADTILCGAEPIYVPLVPPGSSFFREPVNNLIRLHFAKRKETLNKALNRLEAMRSCF